MLSMYRVFTIILTFLIVSCAGTKNSHHGSSPASSDYEKDERIAALISNTQEAMEAGRYDLASEKLSEALELAEELENSSVLAFVLTLQGRLEGARKQPERAIEKLNSAIQILEISGGPNNQELDIPLMVLADIYVESGDLNNSILLYMRYLDLTIMYKGENSQDAAAAYVRLGILAIVNGDLKTGLEYCGLAKEIYDTLRVGSADNEAAEGARECFEYARAQHNINSNTGESSSSEIPLQTD